MEYRRRSLGLREYSPIGDNYSSGTSFNSLTSSSGNGSPVLSRRRSASPLYSGFQGSNSQLNNSSFQIQRNRKDPSFPQTEDEHLYLFHERIIWNQERSLLPLAHDLADWLNSILEFNILTPNNLIENLQTGIILYKLGKIIERKAQVSSQVKVKPKLCGRMRGNATRGSFFARDNIAMFIQFCKDLGVHSNLLFETEDLVSHGEIRNILICLMEVGRLSSKFGVEPPALVEFEHQIDLEASIGRTDDESDEANKENPKKIQQILPTKRHSMSRIPVYSSNLKVNSTDSLDSGVEDSIQIQKTQLDLKVNEVARISGSGCSCVEETRKEFRLRKLSEGKYLINGRTVFVRLLKGVHVMVRIGGGWETLEEFLVRNDPCRGKGDKRRNSTNSHNNSQDFSNPFNRTTSNASGAQSTPATPCAHIGHPLLQRPMSTPPTTGQLRSRIKRPSFSACSTPTQRGSNHSSRNSLLI